MMSSPQSIPETTEKRKIALKGDLGDASMMDILQLTKYYERSGILRFLTDTKHAEILVHYNNIISATSPHEILFGEYLTSADYITHENLTNALELQKEKKAPLGTILKEMGLIEDKTLLLVSRQYFCEVIFRVMQWQSGRFEFEEIPEENVQEKFDTTIKLDIDRALLEVAHRMDNWRTLANNMSRLKSVLKVNRNYIEGDQKVTLTADQWKILSYVNGRRNILRILEKIGKNELNFLDVINQMIEEGVLIEKKAQVMQLIIPARIPIERFTRERNFPGKFEANLLYKEIDGEKTLLELSQILGFELSTTWENLLLLIQSEMVEVRKGKREFEILLEEG